VKFRLQTRKNRLVAVGAIIEIAGLLTSEDGKNHEYDRALIELIIGVTGLSMETDRAEVEAAIRKEQVKLRKADQED
jgi:hypothetical protein